MRIKNLLSKIRFMGKVRKQRIARNHFAKHLRQSRFEQLEQRQMLFAANWTNVLQPLDVTGDSKAEISPLDVLTIVNELNSPFYTSPTSQLLPTDVPDQSPRPYFDVDCDRFVTPLDALAVINAINAGVNDPSWDFGSEGGSTVRGGRFEPAACSPKLIEGDSFRTELSARITVPNTPSAVRLAFDTPSFDTQSKGSIRDAFEIALLDSNGNPIVSPITTRGTAVFNSTEGLAANSASGIATTPNEVLIGLNGLVPGTTATLVARLINNDGDENTQVRITSVRIVTSDLKANLVLPSTPSDSSSGSPILGTSQSSSAPPIPSDPLPLPNAPIVSVMAIPSVLASGTRIVVSGNATATPSTNGQPRNEIQSILINGIPSETLDASGNYFSSFVVLPGLNYFSVSVTDTLGRATTKTVGTTGVDNASLINDLSRYEDVTPSFAGAYGRTLFGDAGNVLSVDLASMNSGTFAVDAPLLVTVSNISDPTVRLRSMDGMTPQGIPYLNFTNGINGKTLAPASATGSRVIEFLNPNRIQFRYDLGFFSKLNSVPMIATAPDVEALVGKTYSYSFEASDENRDRLSYRIVESPRGMTMDASTAVVTWSPKSTDIGNHNIVVEVFDGRGGLARQRFTLTVSDPPPNRPPVVTSTPIVDAIYGQPYAYQVKATDPDGDTLSYQLSSIISGVKVDSETGEITWLNPGPKVWDASRDFSTTTNPLVGWTYGWVPNGDTEFHPFSNHHVESGVDFWDDPALGQFPFIARNNTPSHILAWPSGVLTFHPGATNNRPVIRWTAPIAGTAQVAASFAAMDNTTTGVQVWHNGISVYEGSLQGYNTRTDMPIRPIYFDVGDTIDFVLDNAGSHFSDLASIDATIRFDDDSDTPVELTVIDGQGGVAKQSFAIDVHSVLDNNPPSIISTPTAEVLVSSPLKVVSGFTSSILVQSQNNIPGLALSNDGILYFNSESGGPIFQRNMATGEVSTLKSTGLLGHGAMVVANGGGFGNDLLHADHNVGQNFAGAVFRTNRITGESTVLLSGAVNRPAQGDPMGVAIGKGGAFGTDLYVMDFQGASPDSPLLERIQPSGQVSIFAEGSPWTVDSVPLRMDISPVGEFGEFIFVADPITKVIWRVSPSGQTSIFNTSEVLTPASVRFAPGGAFGNLLYVLEQNGRIVRIKPDGTVMPFSAAIPGVENGGDLVFDATGEHLYVGIKNRVYDVSAGPLLAYAYLVNGFDADNDTLHYRLISGPSNTSIDAKTGQLSWVPDTLGNYDFHVAVSDGRGGSSTQEFTVQVKDFPGGEIRGLTYNDANGNGVRDLDSEPGLPDWRIYLDTNANGVRDRSEPVTTTDANGNYSFTNLLPGEWIVGEEHSQNYNAVRDFSIDRNPNIPWSYGYTQTRGSEFQTSTSRIQTPQLELWSATDRGPHIIHNSTGQEIPGGIVYPPDVLNLDPSYDGRNSVLRFTAPVSGEYFVKGRFQGIDLTRGPTTDVAILQNSKTVFAGDIRGFFRDNVSTPLAIVPFNIRINAEAGDTIDFSVGHGPDDSLFDSTGVEVVIDGPPSSLGASVWRQTAPTTRTHAVTLASGEIVRGRDFGNTTLSGINHAPTITSNAITNAIVDNRYLYQVKATDEDGDKLIFDLPVRPEGMAIERNSGIIVWIPKPDQEGIHSVIVRVSDGRGGVKLQSFQISVEGVNHGPIITSKPAGPAVANLPYQYRIRAQDAEGDAIVYTLRSAAIGNMTLNATTGILNWTPTNNDIGTHSIDVTATDADGAGQGQKFDLTVLATAVNRIPVLASKPRDEVRLGTNYLYRIDVSDPDGDPLTIQLTTAPQGMSIDNEGIVTWTPTPTQFGTNPVRIRISDGRGGEIDQSFDVAVLTQGDSNSPIFTSTPRIAATQGAEYRYDVVVQGFEDDMISFALERSPQGMSIDPLTGAIRWIPAESQIGTADVMVRAMDTRGAATTQAYVIAVRGSNLPPAISSTPNTTSVVDRLYTYAVRAIDPEGGPLNFSLISKSGDMRIDSLGIVRWNPTPSETGVVPIAIRVTDDQGVSSEQSYSVTVANGAVNLPPVIHSKPGLNATLNQPYEYRVMATDPEGGQLRYALLEFPDGVTLDESTGIVRWTPSLEGIGVITVLVGDFDGGDAEQSFEVTVRDVNAPPTITSTPVTALDSGNTYRYDVRATDPNNDSMTYALLSGPEGMTIDELGRIRWTTKTTDTGTKRIKVSVVDDRGASVFQEFDLVLTADTEAPKVRIQVSSNPVALGETLDLLVTSSDNTRVVSLDVSVDGKPISLDDRGRASLVMAKAGALPIFAEARDGAGNLGQKSIEVMVIDTSVTGSPTVDVTVPAENATITAPTDVIGTIQDPNLVSWKLEVAPFDGGDFKQIATGTNQITDGKIATFDPTMLQNDSYILRLTALNTGGLSSSIDTVVNVTGNLKLGNFTLSFTDLSIPVAGIPITVSRTYDTLNANQDGELGYGWKLAFRDVDLRTSLPKTGDETGGLYTPFRDGTRVYITLPGGQREGYTFRPKAVGLFDPNQRERDVPPDFQSGNGLNAVYFVPNFVPDKGVTNKLTVPRYQLSKQGHEYFQFGGGLPYNPEDPSFGARFKMTTLDGISYMINAVAGKLVSAADRDNNSLNFTDDAVTSSSGVAVTFTRNAQGRITSAIDPAGKSIRYGFDAFGDLVSVTDFKDTAVTLTYRNDQPHYLEQILDPLKKPLLKNIYDSQGRLIGVIGPNGAATNRIYDPAAGTQTTTDALGRTTKVQFDQQGNVTSRIDAAGGRTQFTYDENNNLLMTTDPVGRVFTNTYDEQGNRLTETDEFGGTTRHSYDAFGNRLTETDPLGNTTTQTFDSNRHLLSYTDPNGHAAQFTYDSRGNRNTATDHFGNIIRDQFDTAGRMVSHADPLGKSTTFTYDANGRMLTEAGPSGTTTMSYDARGNLLSKKAPDGTVTRFERNALGVETAMMDALGRSTQYGLDAQGTVVSIKLPGGGQVNYQDNAIGRITSVSSASGRTTRYEYDALDRIVAVILPDNTPADDSDNPQERKEYDAAGRITAEIDPLGNRTEYTYDEKNRRTILRDALGNATVTEYDVAGRTISVTDAIGRTTRFEYDAIGNPTVVIAPDGTKTTTSYTALGRYVPPGEAAAITDSLGITTRYEYDAIGQLVAVIDPTGARTEYTYDVAGNRVTQTDALGHVTRYEFDAASRNTALVLPGGHRSTKAYDAAGRVTETRDADGRGVTFEYDDADRVVAEKASDGSTVTYVYSANGDLKSYTDSRGTTAFEFDGAGRLIRRTDPNGSFIGYAYDAAGNRTELRTQVGTTVSTYDRLNRLSTLTDPDGKVTRYTYNAAGDLIKSELPNGVRIEKDFDAAGRPKLITSTGSSGLLSSETLIYDGAGRVASRVELSRTTRYTYDALGRLSREEILDGSAGNRTISYTYDAVGNRTTLTDSLTGTVSYEYDAADRLIRTVAGTTTTTYTYDASGHTLSREAGPSDRADYQYDAYGRLSRTTVINASGSHELRYEYAPNGIRVSAMTDGHRRNFLIDNGSEYPRVQLETTSAGDVASAKVWGLDLIAQTTDGSSTYVIPDYLGSTRLILDATGKIQTQYQYDAFGRLLSGSALDANDILFAGEPRDGLTGLDYLRARYYDPTTGRFLSTDSFDGEQMDPLSLNRFLYGLADPVNHTDPSGYSSAGAWAGAALGILPILAGMLGHAQFYSSVGGSVGIPDTDFTEAIRIARLSVGQIEINGAVTEVKSPYLNKSNYNTFFDRNNKYSQGRKEVRERMLKTVNELLRLANPDVGTETPIYLNPFSYDLIRVGSTRSPLLVSSRFQAAPVDHGFGSKAGTLIFGAAVRAGAAEKIGFDFAEMANKYPRNAVRNAQNLAAYAESTSAAFSADHDVVRFSSYYNLPAFFSIVRSNFRRLRG